MGEKIKRFRLKPGVTVEALRESGLEPGATFVYGDAVLGDCKYGGADPIDYHIAFPADLSKWNDIDYVLVMDDNWGQPFTPFYMYLDGKRESYPFLDKVVAAYNEWMSSRWYLEERTCGSCRHFIGGGDWNLCCDLPHPESYFDFLCYRDTEACERYEQRETPGTASVKET